MVQSAAKNIKVVISQFGETASRNPSRVAPLLLTAACSAFQHHSVSYTILFFQCILDVFFHITLSATYRLHTVVFQQKKISYLKPHADWSRYSDFDVRMKVRRNFQCCITAVSLWCTTTNHTFPPELIETQLFVSSRHLHPKLIKMKTLNCLTWFHIETLFFLSLYFMFAVLADTKKSKWPFSRRSTVGVFLCLCCRPGGRQPLVCFDVLCFSRGHLVGTLFSDPLLKADYYGSSYRFWAFCNCSQHLQSRTVAKHSFTLVFSNWCHYLGEKFDLIKK